MEDSAYISIEGERVDVVMLRGKLGESSLVARRCDDMITLLRQLQSEASSQPAAGPGYPDDLAGITHPVNSRAAA